jgi:hypothetical protein
MKCYMNRQEIVEVLFLQNKIDKQLTNQGLFVKQFFCFVFLTTTTTFI